MTEKLGAGAPMPEMDLPLPAAAPFTSAVRAGPIRW